MFRAGYRYMPSTNGPTEHRRLLEATARYPLVRGVLLSERNRLDLSSIDGELAWRYRNGISAERTVSIRPITSRPISGLKLTTHSDDQLLPFVEPARKVCHSHLSKHWRTSYCASMTSAEAVRIKAHDTLHVHNDSLRNECRADPAQVAIWKDALLPSLRPVVLR